MVPLYSPDDPTVCRFGSPISSEAGGENNGINNFLRGLVGQNDLTLDQLTINSYNDIIETFIRNPEFSSILDDEIDDMVESEQLTTGIAAILRLVRASVHPDAAIPFGTRGTNFTYTDSDNPAFQYFSSRTCNAYWNPQVPIRGTGVDAMYLGMASQAGEREDTIITPDLRGQVCASQFRSHY